MRLYCVVLECLGALGPAAAGCLLLLAQRLEVPQWRVRVAAAVAVGRLRQATAAPLLAQRLEDQVLEVRLAAAEALNRLGGEQPMEVAAQANVHRLPYDHGRGADRDAWAKGRSPRV